ncbi:unnamed protein product [Phyllotreta striolata]|uniref:Protein sleepless n=1 Tax=Phyllotreta striolata TaxID=444603 RepID=A0A9N9TGN0_PHYSR|nr:unnamed protein product [Phyllotreta striolata]
MSPRITPLNISRRIPAGTAIDPTPAVDDVAAPSERAARGVNDVTAPLFTPPPVSTPVERPGEAATTRSRSRCPARDGRGRVFFVPVDKLYELQSGGEAQQYEYAYPNQDNNLLYNRMEHEITRPGDVLQCYDCNSEYDPRCGDPFNPYTIGIVNCTDRNTPEHLIDPVDPNRKLEPKLCRKIVQKVQGKIRVIRSCGYIEDRHDDKKCFKRTGTKDVEVHFCSCTKSLCNAGDRTNGPLRILVLLFVGFANMAARWA